MIRLEIENKKEANWFKQFKLLKKEFKLKTNECINLFYHLKRGKRVLIQPTMYGNTIDDQLDKTYHLLKKYFTIETKDLHSMFISMVSIINYDCYIIDYYRNLRIWVSNKRVN